MFPYILFQNQAYWWRHQTLQKKIPETWDLLIELTWTFSFCSLTSMVPEEVMQASKEGDNLHSLNQAWYLQTHNSNHQSMITLKMQYWQTYLSANHQLFNWI